MWKRCSSTAKPSIQGLHGLYERTSKFVFASRRDSIAYAISRAHLVADRRQQSKAFQAGYYWLSTNESASPLGRNRKRMKEKVREREILLFTSGGVRARTLLAAIRILKFTA